MPVCLLSTGLRKWIGNIRNSRKLTFSPPGVRVREKEEGGNRRKIDCEGVTCMPYDYKFCLSEREQYVIPWISQHISYAYESFMCRKN